MALNDSALKKDEVRYWKDEVFRFLLMLWLIFGGPLLILGAYLFYSEGNIQYSIIEVLIYCTGSLVVTKNNVSLRFKKTFMVLLFYSLSILILIAAGNKGAGLVCVLIALLFAGFLLDDKGIKIIVIINITVFVLISILLNTGYFNGTNMESYKGVWLINVITTQAPANGLIFMISKIYNGLEKQNQLTKISQQLFSASETKHKAMIANIADFIAIVDEKGVVNYISPNIELRSGWIIKDILNKPIWEKIHRDDLSYAKKEFEDFIQSQEIEKKIEVRFLDKEKKVKYIELTATNLMNDPVINGVLVNSHDITAHRVREQEILYLNYHDVLTGLNNRRFFDKEKENLDHESQLPLSIIVGDINGLKIINDSLGHMEGDKLLGAIARILKDSCPSGAVVARIGGDEFSILLPRASDKEVQKIVKKINAECEEYNRNVESEVYYTSISLGYATKTNISESFDSIQKIAGERMYKRKLLDGRSFRSAVISSMKMALHEKSQETEEHSERIVTLSKAVGEVFGLSEQQLDELELLASLHDIGKIGIDDNILNKPDRLTDKEWIEMKKHSEIGYRIAMASPELMPIAEYILAHHERYDGTGYPQGLSGDDIPLLSRIVSVADSYDAMIEDRPYRKGLSKDIAIDEIIKNSGKQFDPDISKVFVGIVSNPNFQL